jgi:lipopolysaccharide assembly protein A
MRILVWLFRALVFFTLFAFALNNQQEAAVRWFFGLEWRAPMVIVVLIAFGAGCAFGVVAMVPSWWRHRRVARRFEPPVPPTIPATAPSTATPSDFGPEHPPRDGL